MMTLLVSWRGPNTTFEWIVFNFFVIMATSIIVTGFLVTVMNAFRVRRSPSEEIAEATGIHDHTNNL